MGQVITGYFEHIKPASFALSEDDLRTIHHDHNLISMVRGFLRSAEEILRAQPLAREDRIKLLNILGPPEP